MSKKPKLSLVYLMHAYCDTWANFLERETCKHVLKDSVDTILACCPFLGSKRKPIKEGLVSEKVQPSAIFSIVGRSLGVG